MANMTYEDFKQEIKDTILDYLPENFADSTVEINEVQKNNESLDGLLIKSEGTNIFPNIYLNEFYEQYEAGRDMDDILSAIADIRTEYDVSHDFDTTLITDYANVQDRIVPRMISIEGNEELLSNRPHQIMDDLAVIYCVDLGQADTLGNYSVPITVGLMEGWDISQEQLHEVALSNMEQVSPIEFMPMSDVVKEIMMPQILGDCEGDVERANAILDAMIPEDDSMYVLSNKERMFGAAGVLNEDIMAKVMEKFEDGFYILPSSVHEVLIVPADGEMDVEDLERMVTDINETQVAPKDRLSDHVYQYDAETKEIFRADHIEEHEQAKEAMKDSIKIPEDAVADMPRKVDEKEKKQEKGKDRASLKDKLEDKKSVAKTQEKKQPHPAPERKQEAVL